MAARTSDAFRVTVVTMNGHLIGALERAGRRMAGAGVELSVHVAADWAADAAALEACRTDLGITDVVLVSQLFLEEHAQAVKDVLEEHRERYHALVCILSEGPVVKLTRMGKLDMSASAQEERGRWHPLSLLKKLKGERKGGGASGKRQMMVLRTLPKVLKYIPGPAQDLRAYMLTIQAWLSGSEDNLVTLLGMLVDRYGPTDLGATDLGAGSGELVRYPDAGLYHPDLPGVGVTEALDDLPARPTGLAPGEDPLGTVGLLVMRSYLLAGNTAHYDAVIRSLEARGLRVLTAFASGLDNRDVMRRFFLDDQGRTRVDALASLTGFSLVGGPAYNDADAAQGILAELDVPCLTLVPLEFQSVEEWEADPRGLGPLQTALMVSVPELDGSIAPHVFGGRADGPGGPHPDTSPIPERVERIADRIGAMVGLRTTPRSQRKVAVVLFNFPPNAGSVGSAAYLDVWASLQATLARLDGEGYDVEVPADADALREAVLGTSPDGNASRFGTPAHVGARTAVDDYLRSAPSWLDEVEAVWGAAPGRELTDGQGLFVLGRRFGNVFVGVQPPFGIEGDPMRLLFEGGYAPTHAMANFYRWLQRDFGAHAYLHFGTHGALEFLPGKHTGLSGSCWPDRLLGDVPNYYLYAANNPSEGTLAKRRAAATLVTYRTPSVTKAGLYKGLVRLRASLDRLAGMEADDDAVAAELEAVQVEADAMGLLPDGDAGQGSAPDDLGTLLPYLRERLLELEYSLIPHGLHVVGRSAGPEERADLLQAVAQAGRPERDVPALADLLPGVRSGDAHGSPAEQELAAPFTALATEGPDAALRIFRELGADTADARRLVDYLAETDALLRDDRELDGLVRALDGRFVPPAPGGDLLRRPEVLPTGRNLYAFDPYRIPDAGACAEGDRLVEALLERATTDGTPLPETVAMVLWGTDNMKRNGAPVAQALALMGAAPRFDTYGRLAGASLVPLHELGRPRIDVVMTTSGVFRDLLPLQIKLLAEAALAAATADEPTNRNYVRKHALEQAETLGCSLEEAALRVFSNAQGAYGANVNLMVDRSVWEDEDALADAFLTRKSFAYGTDGRATAQPELMQHALRDVGFTFQNLDSVELGVTDVDQYFDSLGGLTRLASRGKERAVPALIGDETRGEARVRSLDEQIALEARTRILNPRWYEGMLDHGYQGVRELESRVTTAMGWSATTATVPEWVYQQVGETFVLDPEMRARLSELNPHATAGMASRLVEACDRGYWAPDDETLDRLHDITDELEDRMEGVEPEFAA